MKCSLKPETRTTSADLMEYGILLAHLEKRTAHDALAEKALEWFEHSDERGDLNHAAKIFFLLPITSTLTA